MGRKVFQGNQSHQIQAAATVKSLAIRVKEHQILNQEMNLLLLKLVEDTLSQNSPAVWHATLKGIRDLLKERTAK